MKYWCKINDASILWHGSNSLMLLSFFYCCFHMKNVTHFTLTELNTTIILGFTRKKFRSLPLLHIILCGSPQRQSQKFNLFYEPALKVLEVSEQKYTYFFFIKLKPSLEPLFEDSKQKNSEQKKHPNENGYLLSKWLQSSVIWHGNTVLFIILSVIERPQSLSWLIR